MSCKLLQYETLKAVLRHVEPNLRILLARRLPSIRNVEKSIPFKADTFIFNAREIQINNTLYSIGIIRKYENSIAPGVAEYELDEYGFEVPDPDDADSHGDVKLGWDVTMKDGSEERRRLLEHQLWECQDKLCDMQYRSSHRNIQRDLENLETLLLPFRYRQHNCTPPYTQFLQLTVKSPRGNKVYRMLHNMQLHEATRKLNKVLLDGRTIRAENLSIPKSDIDIRLPLGIKMRIRNLYIQKDCITELETIIDASSYPLNILEIEIVSSSAPAFDHKVLQQAGQLQLRNAVGGIWLRTLRELKNSFVRLNVSDFSADEHIDLARDWLENGRDVGTRFLFDMKNEEMASSICARIVVEFDGAMCDDRCFIIPMNDSRELELSYRPLRIPQHNSTSEEKWIFEMAVCQVYE